MKRNKPIKLATYSLGSQEQRGYFGPGAGSTDPPKRASLYSSYDSPLQKTLCDIYLSNVQAKVLSAPSM